MSVRNIGRCIVAMSLAALASGCSLLGFGGSESSVNCRANPSQCMYNGPYEAGERDYAEQEAKRLNRAEYERLRRSANR